MEKLENMVSIPPSIAAEVIKKPVQFVRKGLQQQRLPIGSAVLMSSEWSYHISFKLLEEYIGKERIIEYEKEKNEN